MKLSPPTFSTHRLLGILVFVAIFTMSIRYPADADTWWHLSAGQYMVQNRTILTFDPFSHTRTGQPWINHGWLAQIFWYSFYSIGSWPLLSLMLAGLVTAAFWMVWQQIEANVFVAAVATILGAIVSSIVWAARPQMISFLLAAITATLLHRFKRKDHSLLPWLPLLMLLWANMHGGFAIGFMLMAAYLMGEAVNNLTGHREDPVASWSRLKHLLLVMGLSLIAVVVNPYTWRMWLYPFQTVGIGALHQFIQEWQSPNFHLPHIQPFALMLLLILAAVARAGRQADWTDLALVAMWALWALFAARNIAIFGLVTAPVLARYGGLAWNRQWQQWGYQTAPFSRRSYGQRRSGPLLNWLLLGLICLVALLYAANILRPAANFTIEQETLPYHAVEFIEAEQPAGRLFNSYNWGGYLIFRLWPDYRVYIDGRTDLYDDPFVQRYVAIRSVNPGWQQLLRDDGVNLILIENNSTLDKFLRREAGWQELYRDELAVIFGRVLANP